MFRRTERNILTHSLVAAVKALQIGKERIDALEDENKKLRKENEGLRQGLKIYKDSLESIDSRLSKVLDLSGKGSNYGKEI